ncbi:MAG: zinc-ribbon domain containing protein [Patescibacteria group bacterium]
MYQDKRLACRTCGAVFIFNAAEQEFFALHGLENEPRHCPACRRQRKAAAASGGPCEVVCANCGAATIVPFKPRGDRPVYCKECLAAIERR